MVFSCAWDRPFVIERQVCNISTIPQVWTTLHYTITVCSNRIAHTVANTAYLIGSCYFPPGADDAASSESISKTIQLNEENQTSPKKHILVCGDFNQPGINWKSHAMSIKSNAGAKLIQVAEENDLHQRVKTPTRCTESCQNILDLLFTNQPLSVDNVLVIQGFSDHDAITASIRMKAQFLRQNPRKIFS